MFYNINSHSSIEVIFITYRSGYAYSADTALILLESLGFCSVIPCGSHGKQTFD